jgi:hypothetical protein
VSASTTTTTKTKAGMTGAGVYPSANNVGDYVISCDGSQLPSTGCCTADGGGFPVYCCQYFKAPCPCHTCTKAAHSQSTKAAHSPSRRRVASSSVVVNFEVDAGAGGGCSKRAKIFLFFQSSKSVYEWQLVFSNI